MKYYFLITTIVGMVAASVTGSEQGSYVNPNPRQYENCDVQDLVQLSACCNDVLNKLDDCKANDLACECCALQSMKKECYGLCPGNPSNNFLTALFDDCSSLSDINACNLPFRKDDSVLLETVKDGKNDEAEEKSTPLLKSKVKNEKEEVSEDTPHESDDTVAEPASTKISTNSTLESSALQTLLNTTDSHNSTNFTLKSDSESSGVSIGFQLGLLSVLSILASTLISIQTIT